MTYYQKSSGSEDDLGAWAINPQVTEAINPPLSASTAFTFTAAEVHRTLAGTKLHCLMTDIYGCEQVPRVVKQSQPRPRVKPTSICHQAPCLPVVGVFI